MARKESIGEWFVGPILFIFGLGVITNTMPAAIIAIVAMVIIMGVDLSKQFKDEKAETPDRSDETVVERSHTSLEAEIVYSELLKTDVRLCCHQSARLNDQYCICGRAIPYPVANWNTDR